jgi:hypothetical protein
MGHDAKPSLFLISAIFELELELILALLKQPSEIQVKPIKTFLQHVNFNSITILKAQQYAEPLKFGFKLLSTVPPTFRLF